MDLKYGQKIKVSKRYSRFTETRDGRTWRIWKSSSCLEEGIFLGFRNIWNGIIRHGEEWDYDIRCWLESSEKIKAAYVSLGPNKNAIYVPISNICTINEFALSSWNQTYEITCEKETIVPF